MKNGQRSSRGIQTLITPAILTVSFCSICAPPSRSAPGKPQDKLWNFTTPTQMKAVIPKYLNNPRATYYIIMRATNYNLGPQAAVIYGDLLKEGYGSKGSGKVNAFHLMSAYAFSHFMATGPLSREYFRQQPSPIVQRLRDQELEADGYRTQALEAMPKSPEVLLEASIAILDGSSVGETPKKRVRRAIGYTRKVVQLAPNWADAHYWLGEQLTRTQHHASDKNAWGQEAITAYEKAEQLEPGLRADCLRARARTWQMIGQRRKALECLDAFIQLKPEQAKKPGIIKWRQSLVKQLQAKRS